MVTTRQSGDAVSSGIISSTLTAALAKGNVRNAGESGALRELSITTRGVGTKCSEAAPIPNPTPASQF